MEQSVRAVEASRNVMAHAQKPDFVFRRNLPVHLNRQGASVQSTTGSRGVRISGSNAGCTMFRGSVKGTGYPLHTPVSPSLPPPPGASPCALPFQLEYTYIDIHKRESNWNPSWNTLETDRPPHDRLAACVIAQQQPSPFLFPLRFHSLKENYGTNFFKDDITPSSSSIFLNCLCLNLCNLKSFKSRKVLHFKAVTLVITDIKAALPNRQALRTPCKF